VCVHACVCVYVSVIFCVYLCVHECMRVYNYLAVNGDVKTHGSVLCSPRNQETLGVRQTSVHFTRVKKTPFSRICRAVPEICAFKVRLIFFVFFLSFFFFLFFSQHFLNCYNSCMLCWIALKFGSLLKHIRVYL